MRQFPFFSIICSAFLAASPISAQTIGQSPEETRAKADAVIAKSGVPKQEVAAVVNETVITTFDVKQRMRLMLISSGGRIPLEAFGQLQQQALRDLIEEKLKLQEAAKFELNVPDAAVDDELELMAAQSNLNVTQLGEALDEQGIAISSLRKQIEASISWPELVQGRFRDRVRVNDDEVETTLDRMREDASLEQYLVSEICIAVDDPARAQQYYQGALQLIAQMRQGVPFSVVASQFSACTTAAVGGDVGWVRPGELPPEIDSVIRDLPTGSVTNPIPSEGAFMIMAVRDRREAVAPGEPSFTLAYASADQSLGNVPANNALEKLGVADPCTGRDLRIDLGPGVEFALLENVTLGQIAEPFRGAVEDLQRGETSPVIKADGAYHAVYVCDKDEGLGLPSREAIRQRIFSRQLNRIGQQYLRDIETTSTVDIRLREPLFNNG